MSYPQWGDWALALFGYPILSNTAAWWVTEISKWMTVILTGLSGIQYLWRNREIYLSDI